MWRDVPETRNKISAVIVMKTFISQNWSAVLLFEAASFPTALEVSILKVTENPSPLHFL